MIYNARMPNPTRGRQPPQRLLILHHPKVPAAHGLAQELAAHLAAIGAGAEIASIDDPAFKQRLPEVEMVIALGGDGTMLRAGTMCAPFNVPVLGVNLGRLGFLAEVQPAEWKGVLARVMVGDYWLENRMLLRVDHRRAGEMLGAWWVLNECVVSRGAMARPVRLITEIDGGRLTTYVADGLIVATPTGSTAYALAAGGPILPPELRNILLLAVAPHLSLERAIVLAEGATVGITIKTDHQAIMSTDGQVQIDLADGDRVEVRASEFTAQFVRLQEPSYFYRTLMARMAENPAA